MATISSEKIYLKGVGEWQKKITYSKGLFRVKIPDIICADMNLQGLDCELNGNSEEQVNISLKQKIKEWEEVIKITTKVIIFKAEFQGALAKETFLHKWENGYTPSYWQHGISDDEKLWHFNKKDISFNNNSLGLTIQWAIYEKIEVKSKSNYKCLSGRYFDNHYLINNRNEKMVEIDWTAEREKFFLELDESFARMISKVYDFLGNLTTEKLQLLTDSGFKLLN